jgi:hypothetical protein
MDAHQTTYSDLLRELNFAKLDLIRAQNKVLSLENAINEMVESLLKTTRSPARVVSVREALVEAAETFGRNQFTNDEWRSKAIELYPSREHAIKDAASTRIQEMAKAKMIERVSVGIYRNHKKQNT